MLMSRGKALDPVVSLMVAGGVGRAAWTQAVLAILVGWVVGQFAEDHAFRSSWSADYAAAQQSAAGVETASQVASDELAFYTKGAEAALSAEMQARLNIVRQRATFRASP